MWCIVITYFYVVYDTYDKDCIKHDYEIDFCNTEEECDIKYDLMCDELLKTYNNRGDTSIDIRDISYDKYKVPETE